MNNQTILAVRSSELPSALTTSGFHAVGEPMIGAMFETAGLWLGPRGVLESDETFRQVIPYILLRYGSRLLVYRRAKSGAEKRLYGRLSIGVGGHVDLADVSSSGDVIDFLKTLRTAADRELCEEIGRVSIRSRKWVGVLVDDSTPVSRVHLGVVGVWVVENDAIAAAEDSMCDVKWHEADRLAGDRDALESWSAALLPHLAAVQPS